MGVFFNSDINNIYVGNRKASSIYIGDYKIWPTGLIELPVGTQFNFDYTGDVQSIVLPAGRYKLQCWGAQGGSVTGEYYGALTSAGSQGGYSEGVLKLDNETTLYVFVGGKGTDYASDTITSNTSNTIINGGWNGGGCGITRSSYTSGDEYGESFPRPGGGATDFALVTSDMSYSSSDYRNNRSTDSLKSRILVAGGGAGASAYYTEITNIIENDSETLLVSVNEELDWTHGTWGPSASPISIADRCTVSANTMYKWVNFTGTRILTVFYDNSLSRLSSTWDYEFTTPSNACYIDVSMYNSNGSLGDYVSGELYEVLQAGTTTSTYEGSSYPSKQGGGTSGKGKYPGTQSSAGSGGAFGFGANQTSTDYMYCAGGGGGGWYGGGTSKADSNVDHIGYNGGGSGFVNIASNASYRPSGYTGLELESGTTTAGDTSFESVSGGTETGHSGNGYARITVLDPNPVTPEVSWTWSGDFYSTGADVDDGIGWMYYHKTTDASGSSVIRCTFSGVTSITFNCMSSGESNYDYVTIGNLDESCTRNSYLYSLRGNQNVWKTYTYTCDKEEHFVEFCYSKDGSVDEGDDRGYVYIKSYTS